MLLVLSQAEIVSLKEKTLQDPKCFSAPINEVGKVVSGEECASFGSREHVDRRSCTEGSG